MYNEARKNPKGNCPYCHGDDYDSTLDVEIHPNMTKKGCNGCKFSSVRHANGAQYPLQDPTDPNSDPVLVSRY